MPDDERPTGVWVLPHQYFANSYLDLVETAIPIVPFGSLFKWAAPLVETAIPIVPFEMGGTIRSI